MPLGHCFSYLSRATPEHDRDETEAALVVKFTRNRQGECQADIPRAALRLIGVMFHPDPVPTCATMVARDAPSSEPSRYAYRGPALPLDTERTHER